MSWITSQWTLEVFWFQWHLTGWLEGYLVLQCFSWWAQAGLCCLPWPGTALDLVPTQLTFCRHSPVDWLESPLLGFLYLYFIFVWWDSGLSIVIVKTATNSSRIAEGLCLLFILRNECFIAIDIVVTISLHDNISRTISVVAAPEIKRVWLWCTIFATEW